MTADAHSKYIDTFEKMIHPEGTLEPVISHLLGIEETTTAMHNDFKQNRQNLKNLPLFANAPKYSHS